VSTHINAEIKFIIEEPFCVQDGLWRLAAGEMIEIMLIGLGIELSRGCFDINLM